MFKRCTEYLKVHIRNSLVYSRRIIQFVLMNVANENPFEAFLTLLGNNYVMKKDFHQGNTLFITSTVAHTPKLGAMMGILLGF